MSTVTTPIMFSEAELVAFREPQGSDAKKLRLYIKAAGHGPFVVLGVQDSNNPEAHPQTLTLGDTDGNPRLVSYSGGAPEPFEVSGYWLEKVVPGQCQDTKVLNERIISIIQLIPKDYEKREVILKALRSRQQSLFFTPPTQTRNRWAEVCQVLEMLPDEKSAPWTKQIAELISASY